MGRGQNWRALSILTSFLKVGKSHQRVLSWGATLSDLFFEGALRLQEHRRTGQSDSMCGETGLEMQRSSR